MITIGLDTGFFFRLHTRHPQALEVWHRIATGSDEGVISCITLFELERLGLRGALPKESAEVLVENIPIVCKVVWLGQENKALFNKAARFAHGNGLSMADSLILASLIQAGASIVYTTDSDIAGYESQIHIVRL